MFDALFISLQIRMPHVQFCGCSSVNIFTLPCSQQNSATSMTIFLSTRALLRYSLLTTLFGKYRKVSRHYLTVRSFAGVMVRRDSCYVNVNLCDFRVDGVNQSILIISTKWTANFKEWLPLSVSAAI